MAKKKNRRNVSVTMGHRIHQCMQLHIGAGLFRLLLQIRPASMMMSIDSLVIQNLLPKDSGVYHCVVMVTPKQPVVTAVYSLVVGENWIHTFSTSKLVLSCNSKGLGSLFRNAVRTWNHRLGKETAPALKEDAIFNSVDLRFSGTWTCIVTDIKTKRTWVTARYKVIVDPPPPFLVRLKIRAMDNKTAAFGIVFGTLFFCMVIYEGLVERFKKKNESFKKEMDFFKTTLHLDVPITGTVNEAVSDTLSLENESLLQNNETTDKTEG